ncbi:MAG: TIGR00341 family protein [Firmicutes bacterium HGW-Firmicutes-15]|nr:MAG: TIGR00341 family protein [Firmicutes bacterium HGW-Firmicutes-15]
MIGQAFTKFLKFRPHRTIKIDKDDKIRIYQKICQLSQPTFSFYLMVVLSTIIASFGLLAGSTAVVIGAMLVAPLMGPIFGIGLGLSNGDRRLIKNSVFSELAGIIMAITIAVLIGLIPIRLGLGPEILSRTQPTIYDIIIALFSGFAGAYALVDEKIGSALPGVAIATALVPPLASCGICLALQQWSLAGGAFLLFFVNLLAIELAASTVYWFYGLIELPANVTSIGAFFRRFWLSLTILIFVAVFMTTSLQQIAANRALSESLKKIITEQVAANTGARVSDIRYQYSGKNLQVMAEVLTPQEIDSKQVAQIEKSLQNIVNNDIQLIVRSLISRDSDNSGYVFITENEKARRFEQNKQNLFLSNVSSVLKQGLTNYPGSSLVDIQNAIENGINNLNTVIRTPSAITPEQVAILQANLTANLNVPIHLTVRSIITRDVDATRYLYDEKAANIQLSGDKLFFHTQLEKTLKEELKTSEPAVNLLEFNYAPQNDIFLVIAKIRTPVVFGPEQVSQVEKGLQNRIDPRIKLIIRSVLGADSTSDWYLGEYDDALLDTVSN